MVFPWILVAFVVLVLGAWMPLIVFAKPLMVVVPVPLAAPNPIVLPVMVANPAEPGETKMPLYRSPVVVNVRAAV